MGVYSQSEPLKFPGYQARPWSEMLQMANEIMNSTTPTSQNASIRPGRDGCAGWSVGQNFEGRWTARTVARYERMFDSG